MKMDKSERELWLSEMKEWTSELEKNLSLSLGMMTERESDHIRRNLKSLRLFLQEMNGLLIDVQIRRGADTAKVNSSSGETNGIVRNVGEIFGIRTYE